jgi:uncharacterized protein (DUF1778 family)
MPAKRRTAVSERLEACVSRDLKRLCQRAADLQGITLCDFITASARQAALQTGREHDQLDLSGRDTRRFVEALSDPPVPCPRLRAAARRYQKFCKAA